MTLNNNLAHTFFFVNPKIYSFLIAHAMLSIDEIEDNIMHPEKKSLFWQVFISLILISLI